MFLFVCRYRSDCRFCRNTLSVTVSGGLKLIRVQAAANSSSSSAWPGLSRCVLPRRTPDADISLQDASTRQCRRSACAARKPLQLLTRLDTHSRHVARSSKGAQDTSKGRI